MMGKMKFYLLLPMIAVLAFSSVSFAQSFDKEALKAELRAELKAELKKELLAELRSETKADVQEATLGLRDVLKADFRDEIRSEIMQEEVRAIVSESQASGLLSGLYKGVSVTGFIDTNYMNNLRNHGEGSATGRGTFVQTRENTNGYINFVGENEEDTFVLQNFAMFMDKEATDEHPIGWQVHTYWGETAKRITFSGPGPGGFGGAAGGGTSDVDRDDIFTMSAANITWNVPVFGKTIPVTMGKMYTWIGYELVENIGNPNYSHGTVYNNAIPFTHTGASFDVSAFLPSDKVGLTLYYVNGWDSNIDNNEGKTFGAYLTYEPNSDFFISFAGIIGPEGWGNRELHTTSPTTTRADPTGNGNITMMYDIVATYSLPQVDKLSLGFNWDHGYSEDTDLAGSSTSGARSGAHWWAAVGYLMYDFTDNQQGAFRYEYFDDQDGAKFFGHSMWTVTYTHNITIANNLLLRPEVRFNKYNIPGSETAEFPTSEEPAHGDKGNTFDSETILGIGVEYVF